MPLLTREQEYHLFRKFNYLKHKATKLREKLDPAHARTSVMNEIEKLYDEAVQGQERDRAGQPAAGGVDRQAARQRHRRISSAW